MTSTSGAEGRRGRSIEKRRAMLQAARELFVKEGYELASVDAIAARANVSKRTVYDHFGDKETVFAAVLEELGEKLSATVQIALDREASATGDLRARLLGFARYFVMESFPSSDYAHYRRLSARRGSWYQDRESAISVEELESWLTKHREKIGSTSWNVIIEGTAAAFETTIVTTDGKRQLKRVLIEGTSTEDRLHGLLAQWSPPTSGAVA